MSIEWLKIVGPVLALPRALKWIAHRTGMLDPRVVSISNPRNSASEPYLRWYHVQVETRRRYRWIDPGQLQGCAVDLAFTRLPDTDLPIVHGAWSTPRDSQPEVTLRPGDGPRPIPIVLRSIKPANIYNIRIQPGRVYVTDETFLTQHAEGLILGAGEYAVKVIVRIGDKIVAQNKFFLEIRGDGLDGFVLTDWLDHP